MASYRGTLSWLLSLSHGKWLGLGSFCLLSKPLAEIEAKSVCGQGEVKVEPTDGKGFVDSLPPFCVSLSHPSFPSWCSSYYSCLLRLRLRTGTTGDFHGLTHSAPTFVMIWTIPVAVRYSCICGIYKIFGTTTHFPGLWTPEWEMLSETIWLEL